MHRILSGFMTCAPNPLYIGHRFESQEAIKAMRFFQTGRSIEKIVLEISR